MSCLLDSHAVIWAVDDPAQLSPAAANAIQHPAGRLYLSAASVIEIAIKVGLGKLVLSLPFENWMNQAVALLKLDILPVTVPYANRLAGLPDHHRDPFDRLIIAQALVENWPVVSIDVQFDAYGVTRIW